MLTDLDCAAVCAAIKMGLAAFVFLHREYSGKILLLLFMVFYMQACCKNDCISCRLCPE